MKLFLAFAVYGIISKSMINYRRLWKALDPAKAPDATIFVPCDNYCWLCVEALSGERFKTKPSFLIGTRNPLAFLEFLCESSIAIKTFLSL